MALHSQRVQAMKLVIERVSREMSATEQGMKRLGEQIAALEQKISLDKARAEKDELEKAKTEKEMEEARKDIGRHARTEGSGASLSFSRTPALKQAISKEEIQIKVDKQEMTRIGEKIKREEQDLKKLTGELPKAEATDRVEAENKRRGEGEKAKGRSRVAVLESRKRVGDSKLLGDRFLLKREESSLDILKGEFKTMKGRYDKFKAQRDGYESELVRIEQGERSGASAPGTKDIYREAA